MKNYSLSKIRGSNETSGRQRVENTLKAELIEKCLRGVTERRKGLEYLESKIDCKVLVRSNRNA